jgi:hypothetical protein
VEHRHPGPDTIRFEVRLRPVHQDPGWAFRDPRRDGLRRRRTINVSYNFMIEAGAANTWIGPCSVSSTPTTPYVSPFAVEFIGERMAIVIRSGAGR